jgi:predicted NBD/HSP70 family sugar kinase
LTGLTQAGITKIVKRLLEIGIVSESPTSTAIRGRPQVTLKLNESKFVTMGIRLNRDYVRLGICDLGGHLIEQSQIQIDASMGVEKAFSEMKKLILKCIEKLKDKHILGIGIAVPGPFLVKEQKILLMSGFEGWGKIALKKDLEETFKLPILIEHDALCGALNEYYYEEQCQSDTVIFVAADKGVGAGVLINGEPFHGTLGTAGEFGHASIDYNGKKCVCGNRGCLELFCSTNTIAQKYADSSKTVTQILLEAKNNRQPAKQIVEETSRFLGIGIVNLIYTFNPKTIVVSDTLAIPSALLYKNIDRVLKERLLPDIYRHTKLVVRAPEKDYILWGANALVLGRLFSKPDSLYKIKESRK